jgi:hypothetical protein
MRPNAKKTLFLDIQAREQHIKSVVKTTIHEAKCNTVVYVGDSISDIEIAIHVDKWLAEGNIEYEDFRTQFFMPKECEEAFTYVDDNTSGSLYDYENYYNNLVELARLIIAL